MNLKMPSQMLFVDHVLGWAARLGDAESARAGSAKTDAETRPSVTQAWEDKVAEGEKTEGSRNRNRRFPYSG